jgi:hypothetical protein
VWQSTALLNLAKAGVELSRNRVDAVKLLMLPGKPTLKLKTAVVAPAGTAAAFREELLKVAKASIEADYSPKQIIITLAKKLDRSFIREVQMHLSRTECFSAGRCNLEALVERKPLREGNIERPANLEDTGNECSDQHWQGQPSLFDLDTTIGKGKGKGKSQGGGRGRRLKGSSNNRQDVAQDPPQHKLVATLSRDAVQCEVDALQGILEMLTGKSDPIEFDGSLEEFTEASRKDRERILKAMRNEFAMDALTAKVFGSVSDCRSYHIKAWPRASMLGAIERHGEDMCNYIPCGGMMWTPNAATGMDVDQPLAAGPPAHGRTTLKDILKNLKDTVEEMRTPGYMRRVARKSHELMLQQKKCRQEMRKLYRQQPKRRRVLRHGYNSDCNQETNSEIDELLDTVVEAARTLCEINAGTCTVPSEGPQAEVYIRHYTNGRRRASKGHAILQEFRNDAQTNEDKYFALCIAAKQHMVAVSEASAKDRDCRLSVGNLPSDVKEEELREVFNSHGEIKKVRILEQSAFLTYREALITYAEKKSCDDAVEALSLKHKLRQDAERAISVKFASLGALERWRSAEKERWQADKDDFEMTSGWGGPISNLEPYGSSYGFHSPRSSRSRSFRSRSRSYSRSRSRSYS